METSLSERPAKLADNKSRLRFLPKWVVNAALAFDRRMDGAVSFFIKHWGKSRFMIAMSKRAQVLGLEKLWKKSPKAFAYFFLFYLVRDTILYILIPIYLAGFVGE